MLRRAVKFLLPNCAQIVEEQSLREAHLELLRLPYPIVAFEAPRIKDDPVDSELNGFQQSTSTRRIALCWEMDEAFEAFPGLNQIASVFPEGGIFVLPIYYADSERSWRTTVGGTFVPYDSVIDPSRFEQMEASRIAEQALFEAGRAKRNGYRFRSEPFIMMPEIFQQFIEHAGGNVDQAFAQVTLDSGDEVTMAIQACSVLNCANVGAVDVLPSSALNAKRVSKGKVPFFTYKVLQITADRSVGGGGGLGGANHASPRTHLRRGHLRRLRDRTFWVRAAIVNAASADGVVVKDYKINPS